MKREEFERLFTDKNTKGFYLVKDTVIFKEPLQIWDIANDVEIPFNSVDELWNYIYKGMPISRYIEKLDGKMIYFDN